MESQHFTFPKGFLWGAATSAHQVEGGNDNDWTAFERQVAYRQAQNARLCQIDADGQAKQKAWPEFILQKYPNPLQEKNYISGKACDHYNRFSEDFDIAKSLGHNAHRFSIEWSRIEPEEGKFDEREIEHYREVIVALRERGMEPFVTLWHCALPLWIRDIGGWENAKTIDYFVRFVEKIAHSFERDVVYWITVNEPEIYAMNSYVRGIWPPQKKSISAFFKVLRNLAQAHRRVYAVIHTEENSSCFVGIAKNNSYFEGWAVPIAQWFWNELFLNRIADCQDFIGLNYYFHNRIKGFRFNQNENRETSDMGWEIYPEGIYHVLRELKTYGKPIYITENGVADARDMHREQFIRDHVRWMAKAMREGVDVRGYFYWSLLDNFEWDKGVWPRFGLVEVNYKTMERNIRQSAYAYARIIKNGF